MKSVVSGLVLCGFFSVSCSKDDDDKKSAGPSIRNPSESADLITGGNFKNTAKNAAEVQVKLNSSADKLRDVDMPKTQSKAKTPGSTAQFVQNFLSFQSSSAPRPAPQPVSGDSETPAFSLEEGSECGEGLESLNKVYSSGASALTSAASALVSFDGAVSEGIVKSGPTEQFAVVYTMDLTKMQADSKAVGKSSDGEDFLKLIDPSASESGESQFNLSSGTAMLGAGANADSAIIAAGFDVSLTGQSDRSTDSVNVKGDVALLANTTLSQLKFSAAGSVNAMVGTAQGNKNVRASIDGLVAIQAGEKPGIDLSVKATSNMIPTADGDSPRLSDKDQVMEFKVAIKKVSDKEVAIDYSATVDGKNQSGKLSYIKESEYECRVVAGAKSKSGLQSLALVK